MKQSSKTTGIQDCYSEEEQLVRGIKEGRDEAYRYLFDCHYAVLCDIAMLYVHDDYTARSLTGDVLFHIWETRATLSIDTSVRRYLIRCIRNKCLDYNKSKCVKTEITTKTMGRQDNDILLSAVASESSSSLLLEHEIEDKIATAVDCLPKECRTVFKLSRFDGKSHAEIAAQLSISVNTVKYHIKNALRTLHNELSDYLPILLYLLIPVNLF